jgi:glycosyltransferase involved in cell wall biosynthesis
VTYISYDGATEPLGASQVVAYLERLAAVADITLISFEKRASWDGGSLRALEEAGVRWLPQRYNKQPPVASTAWDVYRGARAIDDAASERSPDIIHARSYVGALMALRSRSATDARFLFDIRGFWADERVDGRIWRRGLLYRIAKRYEAEFFAKADAVVTLTDASIPQIREWLGHRPAPVAVIPTCADIDRYSGGEPRSTGPIGVWNGSIGTWYRFDLAVKIAREMGIDMKVLTRQVDLAKAGLDGYPAEVKTVPHAGVPDELAPGDIGFCLVQPSFSKVASAPTRFAEHLAAGNVVIATSGVGDVAEIVEQERVGVVLADDGEASVKAAVRELRDLLRDPDVTARCRATATRRFSLAAGVEKYRAVYEELMAGESKASDR